MKTYNFTFTIFDYAGDDPFKSANEGRDIEFKSETDNVTELCNLIVEHLFTPEYHLISTDIYSTAEYRISKLVEVDEDGDIVRGFKLPVDFSTKINENVALKRQARKAKGDLAALKVSLKKVNARIAANDLVREKESLEKSIEKHEKYIAEAEARTVPKF